MHADDAILMVEREEELKRLLMKVKAESEKANLKLNIQKPKIMASGYITSWQMGSPFVIYQRRKVVVFLKESKSIWM